MMQRSWRPAGSVLAVLLGLETTRRTRQADRAELRNAPLNGSAKKSFYHQRHVESRPQDETGLCRGTAAASAASERQRRETLVTSR